MKLHVYRPLPGASFYHIILLVLFGLFSNIDCSAQAVGARRLVSFGASSGLADDTLYLDIDQDIAVQLMPFDEVMKVAILHSPLIKYQNEITNSLNSAYAVSKVQILQNISGFANYSGGNQTLLATSATIPSGRESIGQLANGYRVGVDLRISLFDLFGRKHLVRQAYSNYQASIVQKETIELQLKRELITIYQDMITAQQVLKLRLIDEQASLAAYRIAEVELQKGRISADILANATNRYVETKTTSEQVKGDFLKNVHYFETMVGVPIQRLKRN
ncbi:TolC family protein [Spirosoma utsteinense]|uniref:Outer membrane protein TolC n=1 Tax=Spirosoma utsteinense TaxID=2585773 RepID=A0ABR6W258_9BACT|nr:TolC family protein [Spirosoma utsteinense]MBC3786883.1 outer membrane protein TolC [Spirosoma utsteinense]MBC3789820.1 outer membrane protein TolC [Spirosoma utsteinense]